MENREKRPISGLSSTIIIAIAIVILVIAGYSFLENIPMFNGHGDPNSLTVTRTITISQTVSGGTNSLATHTVTSTEVEQSVSTETLTTNSTVTSEVNASLILAPISIDSLVINSSSNSWGLTLTDYGSGPFNNYNIQAQLSATSGSGGCSTTCSTVYMQLFSGTTGNSSAANIGPTALVSGQYYCVSISGDTIGSTVPSGWFTWQNCFEQSS